MKRIFLTISILAFTPLMLFAQKEATTNDGKKVILQDDGTWLYAETTKVEDDVHLNCTDLISIETDNVVGISYLKTTEPLRIVSDNMESGFIITLSMFSKDYLTFYVGVVSGSKCIDADNYMSVLFRDGTRISLQNSGDSNCDGIFTLDLQTRLVFGGTRKQLGMFRTKEVETMRIATSNNCIEIDFTPNQSRLLMKLIDCLLNYHNK